MMGAKAEWSHKGLHSMPQPGTNVGIKNYCVEFSWLLYNPKHVSVYFSSEVISVLFFFQVLETEPKGLYILSKCLPLGNAPPKHVSNAIFISITKSEDVHF